MSLDRCPCGSSLLFDACCGRYVQGGLLAPDPASLMRSRYTAFCRNDIAYLKATWHPETYPEDLGSEEASNWIKLEIIDSFEEGDEGEVEFKASLIFGDKLEILHELSYFDKIDGRWLYHSGDFQNENEKPQKIAKSAPCPCGSGKTFKQCHF